MKRKGLLLSTLLLGQMVSIHAIAMWDEADKETHRGAAHGPHRGNTLFIDRDLESPGTSCQFIAPTWKVIDPKTINISGRARAPGADRTFPADNDQQNLKEEIQP